MQRKGNFWHMMPQANQSRRAIWDAINPRTGLKRLDEAFPQEIRAFSRSQDMMIGFKNGSTWQLAGSDSFDALVGSPPVGLTFSEYALADPKAWAMLRPILADNGGYAMMISTPRGKNHMYSQYNMAVEDPTWFASKRTALDTGVFTEEQLAQEKKELISEFGPEEGMAIFNQEYMCFEPGTRIWTDRGQKNISDVQVQDVVLTHTGRWRRVLKTTSREYAGGMVSIRSAGSCTSLRCTAEHPVRLCDPTTQAYRWVPAKAVKAGDYVVLPKIKLGALPVISSSLAELVAWFIAEGSVAKNLIQFSLNKTETAFAERIKSLALGYGKSYIYESETSLNVVVNSCFLADFLVKECGSGAVNKRIPWHLISGQEELVYKTLIDGDGCRGNYSGVKEVYSTISYGLALDVQMLAHMLGWRARVVRQPAAAKSQTIMGRSVKVSDSYSVAMSEATRKRHGMKPHVLLQKHGVAALVKEVSAYQYSGPVHNFSVQFDESYIAEGRVVHNCSFESAISGAYYAGIIDMIESKGQITSVPHDPALPVTTAWDLGIGDATAIWFYQHVHNEIRVIDYYETSGEGLAYYAKYLKDLPYNYDQHIMPHDIRVRELGTGKSRYEMAQALRISPITIARSMPVDDGINAVRTTLPRMWFDKKKCSVGLEYLRNYHKEYDDVRKCFKNKPYHDFSSHANDAMRMYSVGYRQPVKSRPVTEIMANRTFHGVW